VGGPIDSESDGFRDGSVDGSANSSESDGSDVSEAHSHAFASLTDATMFKMWLRNKIRTQLRTKYLDVRVEPAS
jgi:hypothetical protein